MPSRPMHQRETWWDLLAIIDEKADQTGTAQIPIEVFTDRLGLHERNIYRYLAEMKRLEVLDIRRVQTDFVAGRQPNVYTLLIRPGELRERSEWLAQRHPEPLDHRPRRLPTPEVLPPEPTPIEVEISRDILDALEAVDQDDAQQDAWLAGA